MHSLKKSLLFAIALCVAMVAAFHGGHAFDSFQDSKTECCSKTDLPAEAGEECPTGHECCQSTAAVLVRVESVAPLAIISDLESSDRSFDGGMVKEIDYPPQLV